MKRCAPSAERNKHELLPVLQLLLPEAGLLLELASGSGQHAAYFLPHFPGLRWQPSDRDPDALASLAAWREEAGCERWLPALQLDVCVDPWPLEAGSVDACLCVNMLHISPLASSEGLLRGAARVLRRGGQLLYYGALLREDRVTVPSNLDFDADLRARDPRWGLRRLEDLAARAGELGLPLRQVLDMPNNNYLTVFERS